MLRNGIRSVAGPRIGDINNTRLAAINLEPLQLHTLKNDLVKCYKCSNNLAALPSDEYFCQQHRVSQTSSGGNRLIAPLCSTNYF